MSHLPDLLGWWFHLLDLMERQSAPRLHCVGTVPISFAKWSPFLGLHRMTLTSSQRIFWPIETKEMAPHFKTNEAAQMVWVTFRVHVSIFKEEQCISAPSCFMVYSCSILRSWTVFFHYNRPTSCHFVQNISSYSGVIPSLFLTSAEIADWSLSHIYPSSLSSDNIATPSIPFRTSVLTFRVHAC